MFANYQQNRKSLSSISLRLIKLQEKMISWTKLIKYPSYHILNKYLWYGRTSDDCSKLILLPISKATGHNVRIIEVSVIEISQKIFAFLLNRFMRFILTKLDSDRDALAPDIHVTASNISNHRHLFHQFCNCFRFN